MILSYNDLQREAAELGFQVEPLEKVMWLVEVLNALQRHPFLKERLVLKGGTALNLFVFDLPRLSVDIDLNYVGAVEREVMLQERPRIEEALKAVLKRLNIETRRIATEHAGASGTSPMRETQRAVARWRSISTSSSALLSGLCSGWTLAPSALLPLARSRSWIFMSWPPGSSPRSLDGQRAAICTMRTACCSILGSI